EPAAREHGRQLEALLAGVRSESVGVDEPDDLAGVSGDVGDHGTAVEWATRTTGPSMERTRSETLSASAARLRRGFAAAITRCSGPSTSITRSQLDDS